MRIIVDLHGGNPENLSALAEFQEIKEKVLEEVRKDPCLLISIVNMG